MSNKEEDNIIATVYGAEQNGPGNTGKGQINLSEDHKVESKDFTLLEQGSVVAVRVGSQQVQLPTINHYLHLTRLVENLQRDLTIAKKKIGRLESISKSNGEGKKFT